MKKIVAYTDGGARGNPGLAGSGAVIVDHDGNVLKRVHKALGKQTNNYAEYQAVILALDTLKKMFGDDKLSGMEVEIRTDSQLIACQLAGEYQVKEETLFPLFMKIWNLRVTSFPHISFHHIPREQNSEADRMSNIAMDESEGGSKAAQLF